MPNSFTPETIATRVLRETWARAAAGGPGVYERLITPRKTAPEKPIPDGWGDGALPWEDASEPPMPADLHAHLLDEGFAFWDGLYHRSGTTWRLVCRNGGYRLEVV